VRFRLLPTDDGFFDLFDDAAANVVECSRRLRELLEAGAPVGDASIEAVVACEQRGDEVTKTIMRRLNTSFVTPFDREDIHALGEELDDVVDDMLEVALRLALCERDVSEMPELKEQADVLVAMADEVARLAGGLRSMQGLQPHLEAVDRLESEGDAIFRNALRRLYSDELDARAAVYWKDVVETMEHALDTMEDISDIVEAIALKHA
jgi:predicted phosphate transport protein (TIGR00153 family)